MKLKVIEEKRKRAKENGENANIVTGEKRRAFLDTLLKLEANGQIKEEEVREQTDTFLFAGN
jgi:cytochrome P450